MKSQSQSKLIPDRSSNNLKLQHHHPATLNQPRDSSEVILHSEDHMPLESINSLRLS